MGGVIAVTPPAWADSDGYGYGYGYGSGDYWRVAIPAIAATWPAPQRAALAAAQAGGAIIAYWRSDAEGRACNGGQSAAPVQPGTVETTTGPLRACTKGTLHATTTPSAWRGERVWVVAMWGPTVREGDKIGALRREILGEMPTGPRPGAREGA